MTNCTKDEIPQESNPSSVVTFYIMEIIIACHFNKGYNYLKQFLEHAVNKDANIHKIVTLKNEIQNKC